MASAQGIVRLSGLPVDRCYYTAYYRSVNGGSAGPGAGQRASQWISAVLSTEASGLYSVSLSSDLALGAAATVAAGDQLVVLFWSRTGNLPAEAGGSIYLGQSRTDGSGGTHVRGFKASSSTAANYADNDLIRTVVFTMTGNSWTATPGAVGGTVNGDVDLLANATPTASISGASLNSAAPTTITRAVVTAFINASSDDTVNKLFAFNGQTLLEAMSSAHDPGDGTPTDGSRYTLYVGTTYGRAFGVPSGGDVNGPAFSSYAGPLFTSHAHIFPSIDVYPVRLTVKDDSQPPITDTKLYYFKTHFRAPVVSFGSRRWASWSAFLSAPNASNPALSSSNANTVNDVVHVPLVISNPDASASPAVRTGRWSTSLTFTGSTQTIAQTGIGVGVAAPMFLNLLTQSGSNSRKCFVISAATSDSITIVGDTSGVSTRDWFSISGEPRRGSDLTWDFEVDAGAGYTRIGKPVSTFSANVSSAVINSTGIGQSVMAGWKLSVIDGPARGVYTILSVFSDDAIVVDSAVNASLGDSFEIGCRDSVDCFWPQERTGTLNFRVTAAYANGWSFSVPLSAIVNNGVVNNLPPVAIEAHATAAGSATTYNFDGRKSYGTVTTFVQVGVFNAAHVLNGSLTTILDTALNTTGLRDAHAWLHILDADGGMLAVFPITHIDRETPLTTSCVIGSLGSTETFPAGTRFRTTNVYEIDGGNHDNDIAAYTWSLRSSAPAALPPAAPTSGAEFALRFPRVDGAGSGAQWPYTYSASDDLRWGCVQLTVADATGASSTTWEVFTVAVSNAPVPGGSSRPRRVEWE